MNELRTPMHPLNIRNIDLYDSVVMNEDCSGEDSHKSFLLSELFGAQKVDFWLSNIVGIYLPLCLTSQY